MIRVKFEKSTNLAKKLQAKLEIIGVKDYYCGYISTSEIEKLKINDEVNLSRNMPNSDYYI